MQIPLARFIGRNEPPVREQRPHEQRVILAMKCPSCFHVLETPVARCPACKLSLQRLDLKFGMVPRHSRYLTDRSGRISLNDMAQLRGALRLFEKKFPQTLFSIFVDELPAGTSVSEYAFWLANRARFSSLEKKQGDNFDLLLEVDLAIPSASFTAGYGLEPQLSEEDLQAVLDELAGPLAAGAIADGLRALLDALIRRLRVRWKQARTVGGPSGKLLAHAE